MQKSSYTGWEIQHLLNAGGGGFPFSFSAVASTSGISSSTQAKKR